MPLLGAHMSIAGGVAKAPERGCQATCDVIQIFTKSNVRWRASPLTAADADAFADALGRSKIHLAFAHSSYLINLCSENPETRRRSRESLADELLRCSLLGLPYLVLHPGAHGGAGETRGIDCIAAQAARALDKAASHPRPPALLFETTSGQGSAIGWRFEHLAGLLERLDASFNVGICFDTCHVFAAGYDLRTRETYEASMAEFDRLVGLERIRAFHLNDSRGALGSRLDRHAHIGKGRLGREAFRLLLADRRFADRPMVLETPKDNWPEMDIRNLRLLRKLLALSTSLPTYG